MKKIVLILTIILLLSLVSCNTDCNKKEVETAIDQMGDIFDDYYDAQRIAGQTPRGSLSSIIESMMDIQDNAEDLEVPLCLKGAKTDLDSGISFGIEAFLEFFGDSEGENIDSWFELSTESFDDMTAELIRIKECAPNCEVDNSRYATKTPTPRPTIATEYIGWAKLNCPECDTFVLVWQSYEGSREVAAQIPLNKVVNLIAKKFNVEEDRYYYLVQNMGNKSDQGWIAEDYLTAITLDE
jgi:hypothetical protein